MVLPFEMALKQLQQALNFLSFNLSFSSDL
jgi:hypothetical protein